MATIFKATDRITDRPVVVKVPHLRGGASQVRFAREAAILGKLDHPGILKIIPTPGKSRPYAVMEYLDGQTLDDILTASGPLPECGALRLASRLCGVLEHMHRRNVIHCDLKPGNIMISDDGNPHIIDFGIATEPAWFAPKFGTPGYMAPEQINGDRVDARTDIYNLGAVLHEAVAGNGMSAQVEEIILHAMAPNPSDRYSSAAAMKADLDSPDKVEVTGRHNNPRNASAWPKRLRVASVVASLAAAPFALFFFFLWLVQHK